MNKICGSNAKDGRVAEDSRGALQVYAGALFRWRPF